LPLQVLASAKPLPAEMMNAARASEERIRCMD
jgi:hypothetical protein